MKLAWYRGCKQDEKQDIEEMVRSATPTLNVLKEILISKVSNLQEMMLSQSGYESPSWAAQQADRIGAIRELNYVISLLTLDRETND